MLNDRGWGRGQIYGPGPVRPQGINIIFILRRYASAAYAVVMSVCLIKTEGLTKFTASHALCACGNISDTVPDRNVHRDVNH